MSFLSPKPPKAPPPPSLIPPTKADASASRAADAQAAGYSSLVSTGSTAGLARKAKTQKSSLIGGA